MPSVLKPIMFRMFPSDLKKLDKMAKLETDMRDDGSKTTRADIIRKLIREAARRLGF